MNCPKCGATAWDIYAGPNAFHTGGLSLVCASFRGSNQCFWAVHLTRGELIEAALGQSVAVLPRSCPDCGAGVVIGRQIAVCEANKYASMSGAGDCRWELKLTPSLRRQADEALAAQRNGAA